VEAAEVLLEVSPEAVVRSEEEEQAEAGKMF